MMLYLSIGLISAAIHAFCEALYGKRPEPSLAALFGVLWAFCLAAYAGVCLARAVRAILKAIADL